MEGELNTFSQGKAVLCPCYTPAPWNDALLQESGYTQHTAELFSFSCSISEETAPYQAKEQLVEFIAELTLWLLQAHCSAAPRTGICVPITLVSAVLPLSLPPAFTGLQNQARAWISTLTGLTACKLSSRKAERGRGQHSLDVQLLIPNYHELPY